MWIFMSNSFLSIVAPRVDHPDYTGKDILIVRARKPNDIKRVFGKDTEEIHIPERDYPVRSYIPREIVMRAISEYIESIDYPNFKDSVSEQKRHDAYEDVWRAMVKYESHLNLKNPGMYSQHFR